MVSIAILAILMSAVFYLLRVANRDSEKAAVLAKLEQINMLISSYHDQYGIYPPVPVYPGTGKRDEEGNLVKVHGNIFSQNHQPLEFWVRIGGPKPSQAPSSWDQVTQQNRLVTFGLFSFFYPRGKIFDTYLQEKPVNYRDIFNSEIKENAVQFSSQMEDIGNIENLKGEEDADPRMVIMSRLLAELERKGIIRAGRGFNIETKEEWYQATVVTGWSDAELCYASVPPYQSYQLWSSGPNQLTCRACWLGICPNKDTDEHKNWIADDIGKFDK